MTSRYRHRRTFDPTTAFPSPVEPGEIIVNTSNRQIAVGDASAATLGAPKPLIGVRFFDAAARYVANDIVVQAGGIYRANATIPPGAFNAANWTQLGVVTGIAATAVTFTPVGDVIATDVQGAIAEVDAEKVARAGDTMAGHLSLPTGPAAANAVRKDYVDAATAALQSTKAPLASPVFTGDPQAPTPTAGDSDTSIATTAFVKNAVDAGVAAIDLTPYAPKASPVFTGDPKAPTPTAGDNDTSIATTAFVTTAVAAGVASVPAPPVAATAAEYLANSAPTKMLTPGAAWSAAAAISLTDAASVAPNLSVALDFVWSLGAAGRTLANPTNGKPGQKGLIFLLGGAGSVTTWGNAWKFPGGVKPTTSASVDIISYVVGGDGTTMYCTFTAGFA
jgi:hypothetical protein